MRHQLPEPYFRVSWPEGIERDNGLYTAEQMLAARCYALEEAAITCEQMAKRHGDMRRAALEVAAENIRALTEGRQ